MNTRAKHTLVLALVIATLSGLLAARPTHVAVAGEPDTPLTAAGITDNGCDPDISFTFVPLYGSTANLQGAIADCLNPDSFKVAVYIYVYGWWTKPYFNNPLTPIQADGSWTCDITTGGNDAQATKIAAFLLPDGYSPPLMSGGSPLPAELFTNAVAFTYVERTQRTITFADRIWNVKYAGSLEGPGPNYFSDAEEDVWVDAEGRLHLKISYHDGHWWSSEVFTADTVGFGDYTFTVTGPIDALNEQAVLGLFTWSSVAPPDQHNRELDVEFSKWANPANPFNAEYVVQPWDTPGNQHEFHLDLPDNTSTHTIQWRANSVSFGSYTGTEAVPGNELESWVYTGSDVPDEGLANARINLWLFEGAPPTDGQEIEVVIEAFTYAPPSCQSVTTIPYDYWFLDGVSGSGVFQLCDDGVFTDQDDLSGVWQYSPATGRLYLRYDTGSFCSALFIGSFVFPGNFRGLVLCRDGSASWGVWSGTMSPPTAFLPVVDLPAPPNTLARSYDLK